MTLDVGLDLFPMVAATLASVTCGVLGNFLVLRRLSLMGDAISHSVLPGLVIAFLIASTRSPAVMFLGAAVAGVATVVLVELVKRLGRVEPGAAMGVVFSVLFALGVLLIEEAARHVDLDADCVLHGDLETLVWYGAPRGWNEVWSVETLRSAPRQVVTLAIACAASFALVVGLFKELRLAAFDPELSTTQGFSSTLLHSILMVFVAVATVASFEAVGSILVIAMLVCPAATARLLTDRLAPQVACSVVVSLVCGLGGYLAATMVPALWGAPSVKASGAMAVMGGVCVAAAALASPRHGVVARMLAHARVSRATEMDDLLAMLFRAEEGGVVITASGARAERIASRRGLVRVERDGGMALTQHGRTAAADVVRRHRLWEAYLVDEAGVAPDHVHATAERLEHLPVAPERMADRDPHGRAIP